MSKFPALASSPKFFTLQVGSQQDSVSISDRQTKTMPSSRGDTGSSSLPWSSSTSHFIMSASGLHSGGAPVVARKSTNLDEEKSANLVRYIISLF